MSFRIGQRVFILSPYAANPRYWAGVPGTIIEHRKVDDTGEDHWRVEEEDPGNMYARATRWVEESGLINEEQHAAKLLAR